MITSVPDLIDKWPAPKVATFARDIGVTVEHAATMKRRNSIPAAHWRAVISAAEARAIETVSLDLLADLAAKPSPSSDSEKAA